MVRTLAVASLLVTASACDRVFQLTPVSDAGAGGDDGTVDVADEPADVGDDAMVDCFADTFDATAIDESKWTIEDSAATTVGQNGTQLVFSLGVASGVNYAQLKSGTRDLTHDAVSVEIVKIPNPETFAEAGLAVQTDGTHRYSMFAVAGAIVMRWQDGGSNMDTSISFDATTRFWRIRHLGGSILYETSQTGAAATWISRRTVAVGLPVTGLHINLFAGTYQTEPMPPGTAILDNLRVECLP